MTEQLRYRIDRRLKEQAEKILADLGCDPGQAIAMFYSQVVRLRGLPFRPSEFAALEEYGATVADADAAEDAALKELAADRKAGKVTEFKGKL
jgi:addiction module RelB/DinJ family antitoxin